MSLIKGAEATVLRPVEGAVDSMGEPTVSWEDERVENVLMSPSSADDMGADRPNGVTADVTLHFPKGYGKTLRGCKVRFRGVTYRVVGNPQPYMEENTPGDWNLPVECEVADG